jgi:hypothetical protein
MGVLPISHAWECCTLHNVLTVLQFSSPLDPVPCAGTVEGTAKVSRVVSAYAPFALEVSTQEFVLGWFADALLPIQTQLGTSFTQILALTSSSQVLNVMLVLVFQIVIDAFICI